MSKAIGSTSLQMSASASSAAPTAERVVDDAIAAVREHARGFARLAPAAKAALLRECIPRLQAVAPAWVAEGARARDADPGEEWLAGPTATVRTFRLLAESLERIAADGR